MEGRGSRMGRTRTPVVKEKPYNSGTWTQGRYNSFITSALRSAWRRWPPKWETLAEAFVGVQENKSTKRQAKHFLCALCLDEFPSTQIQVDHVNPIGSTSTWDEFIARLFCEKDNLQAVCLTCHKAKTLKERQDESK